MIRHNARTKKRPPKPRKTPSRTFISVICRV